MPDFSNLGLTYNLQSVDSLLVKESSQISSYTDYDWEAITANKAKTASLNNLQGGTLTLGGTTNGNGVFSLRNSSDSEVVGMNNNGITVTNGSIVVQNSSGGTVLDASGIVSSTNFTSGNYYASNYISNSVGTVIGTITGSDLTITLTRAANVLFLSSVVCGLNPLTNTYSALVYISINGTVQNPPMKCNFIQSDGPTFTSHYFVSLAAGTHTANLRWTNNLSGGTAEMWERRLTYIVLGT